MESYALISINIKRRHLSLTTIFKINIHEKRLDSDWLRAVQFKCKTGAKSVTPVHITHCNAALRLVEKQ